MMDVCVITGTRAEFGLLEQVMHEIRNHNDLDLKIIVTGMHLSNEFGLTYREVLEAGYKIDDQVEMLLSSDTPEAIAKSVGLGNIGFADAFRRMCPDCILVLGDRYEVFSAVTAAMIMKIPVIHLYGGETTEGAIDEAIRHAITKMSHLHFTSTEMYSKRVIQLGEQPNRVFNAGALAVDNILNEDLLDAEAINDLFPFAIDKQTLLFTLHPTTLDEESSKYQMRIIVEALEQLEKNIVFTRANADADGRVINDMIDDYVARHPQTSVVFTSLGRLRYHSVMKYAGAVVGNSSSGILEAPIMKVPTVNIGNRQKGRIRCRSIIDCECDVVAIKDAVNRALSKEFVTDIKSHNHPYGGGNSAKFVVETIVEQLPSITKNLKKQFYDVTF